MKKNDLYTFVAGKAIEDPKPFQLRCNCSGMVTIMPPFQEKLVVCPICESYIHILIIEGDPGYIIGQNPDGSPSLLPVQGSTHPPLDSLTEEEKNNILSELQEASSDKSVGDFRNR